MTPLYLAAKDGDVETVRFFIGKGCDPEAPIVGGIHDGITPLFIAAKKGHDALVKYLVRRGLCPKKPLTSGRYRGYTPCIIAKNKNHLEIVNYLKKYDCDPDAPMTHLESNHGRSLISTNPPGSQNVVERLWNAGDFVTSSLKLKCQAVVDRFEEWNEDPQPSSYQPSEENSWWSRLPVMSENEFAAFVYRNH